MGKAKNLKKRISSYSQLSRLTADKVKMILSASQVKWEALNNELEALLIEAELIRLHQPQYNILLKDDKSPIYVHITPKPFSSLELIRKRDLNTKNYAGTVLGPYSSAYKLQQVLKTARKIFPWCDKAQSRIKLLSNKKTVGSLDEAVAQQALSKHLQACFYYHLDLCPGACLGKISAKEYQENINQLVLFLRGRKKQVIKQLKTEMTRLADALKFEKAHQVKIKLELIEAVTSQQYQLKPDLILPALHDSAQQNALDHLRLILADHGLIPREYNLHRIEGFDVSNLMGQNASVSMIVFLNAEPDKKHYRLFNIRQLNTPNDTQMLKQAISRRQNHPEWGRPDLIVVDGGKGQIRATLSVWKKQTPIIGIVKNPDRIVLPIKHYLDKKTNRLKIEYKLVTLPADHPTLHLIQNIRDEAHRFAKKQHQRLRKKMFF